MPETFKALMVDRKDGETVATIQEVGVDSLPDGDVTLAVAYSSLNYKDGLAVTGKAKVLRSHPMVPGIDLAGTVLESTSANFKAGDSVLVTGYEIGERYWGGYTQLTRVKSDWLIPVPARLNLRQAMALGTAGLTAMLSVTALEAQGLTPEDQREVVVTGAAGGVGSLAVAILGQLGYNVVASTGRAAAHGYLCTLGAQDTIDRSILTTPSNRPLESERWAGAIDAVGGETLAGLLRTVARGGSVALSGNAGGVPLNTTVLPFILRGINLLGIDSNHCPYRRRVHAWNRLAQLVPDETLELITQDATLEEIPALSQKILQGKVRGRVVVSVGPAGT
jgi:acrylyl-CoA reductase (NADPH)